MCLSAAARAPVTGVYSAARVTRILTSGAAAATVAPAGFGATHAVLIVPIWTRLLREEPFALLGAIGLAWAFDELAQVRGRQTGAAGVYFGGVMFLTIALNTI